MRVLLPAAGAAASGGLRAVATPESGPFPPPLSRCRHAETSQEVGGANLGTLTEIRLEQHFGFRVLGSGGWALR